MFAIKPRSFFERYKKLTLIRIRPWVGHRYQILSIVLKHEVFVCERQSIVNGLASFSIKLSDITPLSHKVSYYSMKRGTFVPQLLPAEPAHPIIAAAELCKIPDSDWDCVAKQPYNYSADLPIVDWDIEKAFPSNCIDSVILPRPTCYHGWLPEP